MPNSYFGELYLQLCTHIKTSVPAIRWIDQDFGQLEEFDLKPEVSFPCVLIDFMDADYDELASLSQTGTVMVSFRLGFAPFSSANNLSPTNVKEKALEYYNLEQKLYEAVQGFETDFSTPLIRKKATSEKRQDALRVRVLTFATSYEDYSAMEASNKQAVGLELEY